jgi:hypothetical protein
MAGQLVSGLGALRDSDVSDDVTEPPPFLLPREGEEGFILITTEQIAEKYIYVLLFNLCRHFIEYYGISTMINVSHYCCSNL